MPRATESRLERITFGPFQRARRRHWPNGDNLMVGGGTSVSTLLVRLVVDAGKRRGLTNRAFHQAFGFSVRVLESSRRVPIAVARQIWTEVPVLVGEPELGVLAVEEAGSQAYGFFNTLVESSPTWGKAMDRMAFCVSMTNAAASIMTVHGATKVTVVLNAPGGVRTGVDLMSTSICLRTRAHMGETASPLAVRYAFPRPEKTSHYARVFRVPVEFGSPRTELVYDGSLYHAPVPGARTELGDLLEAFVLRGASAASKLIQGSEVGAAPARQNSRSFLAEAALALQVCIEQGSAQLSNLASAMGLSSRSLQRHLRESHSSFRELVGQQRAELAARSAAVRSKAATARLLGYADRRSLRRAEARWCEGDAPPTASAAPTRCLDDGSLR